MRYFFEIGDKRCSNRANNDVVKFLFATIFFECKYTSLGEIFSLLFFFHFEFWKLQVISFEIWDNLIYEIFYYNLRQTVQVGQRIMQSNLYLQHYFASAGNDLFMFVIYSKRSFGFMYVTNFSPVSFSS